MKKRKLIGVIAAASLVVGISAAYAKQNQPADQSAQSGQTGQSSQDAQSSQSSPDQQSSQQGAQALPPLPGANEPAGAATQAWDKEKFIKETAQNGMAEVNMAQLGTTKAQDPGLKEIAQRLVTDHSKLNDQVKELAEKKGITLSTEIDPKHQKMIDHLSGLSGSEFDKAFATHMVQGHKKSIAKFKQAASSSNDDTEIRDFAKATLPTLQEHLTQVQKYAPESTAGAAVEEPSGAEKKSDIDSNKSSGQQGQDQNQNQSPQSQSPDSSSKP
jgi:putative membrane protein